jgi:hypothetical protein
MPPDTKLTDALTRRPAEHPVIELGILFGSGAEWT